MTGAINGRCENTNKQRYLHHMPDNFKISYPLSPQGTISKQL